MKDVFQILSQIDGGFVLDAATGRGEFIKILKQNLKSYTQITGIDSSEKSVAYAQKVFPENDVEIYRMNLEQIQYEDASFDTVSISNSLHHLEHPEVIFKELLRVLKPGGLLIVLEMYCDGEQSPAQQTHILMHHWVADVDMATGIFHKETLTRDEIIKLVKKLKLKKQEVTDFYLPVDDPKAAKNCANLMKSCEDTMKRLQALPNSAALQAAGESLAKRIQEIGCASASRLLITGYKPQGDIL
ncbi:MAG TPA: class I SAM-dependent methyltransferase [Candidatus Cloacimonadota bacterium]|nr:class I SAM-dependent methyltransferase [Candidatus Cloacimonadota bacterium]